MQSWLQTQRIKNVRNKAGHGRRAERLLSGGGRVMKHHKCTLALMCLLECKFSLVSAGTQGA